ncbi:MAG: HAD-IIA family hydrolase [Candidatus Izemoplasmatales bacterium]|jgi:HAD superfamily hydrolase (TIGR01450 family)|nr:HAD-IIA family hydrolase [Candidatus Izemoplasmatales bacterium]
MADKNKQNLFQKKLFLLDMDGTIYIDNHLIDGTLDLLSYINQINGRSIYITNNSSKSVLDYVKKLSSLGINATPGDFFTSSMATSFYLKENYKDKLVYVMGTASLIKELSSGGVRTTTDLKDPVEVVLLGYDTELTYSKLEDVCILLKQDLPYIATNPDMVCPTSYGYAPDCGSFADMIYNATKKRPYFIGKPNPMMLQYAVSMANATLGETMVIGDRLYTDIASGKNAGISTVCVLSGEATLEDVNLSDIKPDYVFPSVKELLIELKK